LLRQSGANPLGRQLIDVGSEGIPTIAVNTADIGSLFVVLGVRQKVLREA